MEQFQNDGATLLLGCTVEYTGKGGVLHRGIIVDKSRFLDKAGGDVYGFDMFTVQSLAGGTCFRVGPSAIRRIIEDEEEGDQ